jgi:hypothetical protein
LRFSHREPRNRGEGEGPGWRGLINFGPKSEASLRGGGVLLTGGRPYAEQRCQYGLLLESSIHCRAVWFSHVSGTSRGPGMFLSCGGQCPDAEFVSTLLHACRLAIEDVRRLCPGRLPAESKCTRSFKCVFRKIPRPDARRGAMIHGNSYGLEHMRPDNPSFSDLMCSKPYDLPCSMVPRRASGRGIFRKHH